MNTIKQMMENIQNATSNRPLKIRAAKAMKEYNFERYRDEWMDRQHDKALIEYAKRSSSQEIK